jgi:two-component system osmolarity sensor histidine kinase EnvZ
MTTDLRPDPVAVPRRWSSALETFRAGFFWRTFALFAGLVIASVLTIFMSYRLLDPAPPEQRLAWEVASIVNLTRSALLGATPARRMPLLEQLAEEEGLRVLPLEPSDRINPIERQLGLQALQERLQQILDEETRVARRVNDEEGLWISFNLAGDAYWLVLPSDRIDRQFGPRLSTILWVTGLLSLLGAFLLSWQADRPLAAVAVALNRLGRGERIPPLPEHGPPRLSELRRNFNRMSAELAAVEDDRALALAGISHDLRSPLTRLRLEVELAPLSEDQRLAMVQDIERIDAIVGQFIEFARLGEPPRAQQVDARSEIELLIDRYRSGAQPEEPLMIDWRSTETVYWVGDPVDLRRVATNVLDNALRYGRSADGRARIVVALEGRSGAILLTIEDAGAGISPEQFALALRPFSRLDAARTDLGELGAGSGLGLAIVARIVRRYDGELRLESAPAGGLRVTVRLPNARPGRPESSD